MGRIPEFIHIYRPFDPEALLYDMTISNQELEGFITPTRYSPIVSTRINRKDRHERYLRSTGNSKLGNHL